MYFPLRRIPRYDDPRESTWGRVQIDAEKCNGCNMCVRACPSSVLALEQKKARMIASGTMQCMACGDCAAICPDEAITLTVSYRFSAAYETLDRGELRPPRL